MNEDAGTVLIVAEGDAVSLRSLEESVSTGPRGARVDSVTKEPIQRLDPLPAFEVRYYGW